MTTVELRCAYAYDCDQCGRENFVRAVASEDPADAEPVSRLNEEWASQRQWFTIPTRVRCQHCGTQHSTVEAD